MCATWIAGKLQKSTWEKRLFHGTQNCNSLTVWLQFSSQEHQAYTSRCSRCRRILVIVWRYLCRPLSVLKLLCQVFPFATPFTCTLLHQQLHCEQPCFFKQFGCSKLQNLRGGHVWPLFGGITCISYFLKTIETRILFTRNKKLQKRFMWEQDQVSRQQQICSSWKEYIKIKMQQKCSAHLFWALNLEVLRRWSCHNRLLEKEKTKENGTSQRTWRKNVDSVSWLFPPFHYKGARFFVLVLLQDAEIVGKTFGGSAHHLLHWSRASNPQLFFSKDIGWATG